MPHPERSFQRWQCPWLPPAWRDSLEAAPWLKLFQNCAAWCDESA
jgi:phosphoribosylformylglycinamidine (FGAM) synthase-like amidotransferase family enzyme